MAAASDAASSWAELPTEVLQAVARSCALPLESLRAARLACSAWGLGFAYGFRGIQLRLADCEPASAARLLALLPPRAAAVRARVAPFEPGAPAALERLLAAAPAPLLLELVLELAFETTRAQAGTPTLSSFACAMRRCCAGRPFSIETDGDAAVCCFAGSMLLEQIPQLLPAGLTSFKSRVVALHDRELAPLEQLSSLKVLHLRQGGKDMPAKVNSSLHKVLAALEGVASLEDLRLECDLSNESGFMPVGLPTWPRLTRLAIKDTSAPPGSQPEEGRCFLMASEDTARTLQHLALDLPFMVWRDIERSLCALAADDPGAALEAMERMDQGEEAEVQMPALLTLQIAHSNCVLPPPLAMPALRELSVRSARSGCSDLLRLLRRVRGAQQLQGVQVDGLLGASSTSSKVLHIARELKRCCPNLIRLSLGCGNGPGALRSYAEEFSDEDEWEDEPELEEEPEELGSGAGLVLGASCPWLQALGELEQLQALALPGCRLASSALLRRFPRLASLEVDAFEALDLRDLPASLRSLSAALPLQVTCSSAQAGPGGPCERPLPQLEHATIRSPDPSGLLGLEPVLQPRLLSLQICLALGGELPSERVQAQLDCVQRLRPKHKLSLVVASLAPAHQPHFKQAAALLVDAAGAMADLRELELVLPGAGAAEPGRLALLRLGLQALQEAEAAGGGGGGGGGAESAHMAAGLQRLAAVMGRWGEVVPPGLAGRLAAAGAGAA